MALVSCMSEGVCTFSCPDPEAFAQAFLYPRHCLCNPLAWLTHMKDCFLVLASVSLCLVERMSQGCESEEATSTDY